MTDDKMPPYIPYRKLAEATESVLVAVHEIRDADGRRLMPPIVGIGEAFEEVRALVVRLSKIDPEPVVYMPKPMVVPEGPLADILRATQ